MMAPRRTTARNAAWLILNRCDNVKHDTAALLNHYLPHTDRGAQATDIVYGVIRNRLAIDTVIRNCGRIETNRVKPSVWNLLRIGTYELVYAPKTADYAILNEIGDLARGKKGTRTVGFVNAILRSVQKNIISRQAFCHDRDPRTILPQNEKCGCAFAIELLADPVTDPIHYYSTAFSLPCWLVSEWLNVYGESGIRGICLASNRTPSLVAQPNTLCTTTEELTGRMAQEGIECELNADKSMLCIHHGGHPGKIKAFGEGLFTIQDPTAAEAMHILEPQPGWTVADLCAAPGGKSIALAMLMNDTGTILASDNNAARLQKIRQNVERMRLTAIEVVDPSHIEEKCRQLQKLDAIILDVPCSNTGVLARRVEARWRLKHKNISSLLQTQQQLLNTAAALCQQDTHILYSTCSIQTEENQQQIQQFLNHHPSFVLKTERLTLPVLKTEKLFDHDGGYAAVLARN